MTADPTATARRGISSPLATLSSLAVAANEGKTLAGAMPKILELLCQAGGWSLGHAFRLAPVGDYMLPLNQWWPPLWPPSEPFRRATQDIPIETRGLIDRLRRAGGPVWIEDLADADWLLRQAAALESGLRSLIAFPVVGPTGMIGLVELVGQEPRPVDPAQMELARHAGIILGQVLERESAERHFRTLFDRLALPIALTTAEELRIVEANESLGRLLGSRPARLVGARLGELGIPIGDWLSLRWSGELPPEGESFEFSLAPQGTEARDFVATIADVTWDARRHLLVSLTDVTRLRSAEDEVDRSRARVRALATRLLELQEEERERLARELHDQVGQRLTALRIAIGRLGAASQDEELATESKALAEALLEQVRTLSFELRPAMLDQLGLAAAIRAYVESHAEAAGLRWHVDADDDTPPLERSQQTALFRILQEATTNVVRHAEASELRVGLVSHEGEVTLTVEDDGVGFRVDTQRHVLGLAIMEERAREAGARFAIGSVPGEGTAIRVTCRVRAPGSAHRKETP